MECISINEARNNLYKLVNERDSLNGPLFIKGRKKIAVLVSNEDWEGMQETLLIMQDKELYESILEAAKEPISECTKLEDLKW
jgi:PHD/YefM family antitoxin component YafN of YafNO toxin-antitoxin module